MLPGKAQDNAFTPIHLVAPDASLRATFISFGATTTNFWTMDKNGVFRDIILGFDDPTLYQSLADAYFGPVIGRYANRIRNGTFTIPISKNASGSNKFFISRNQANDTLHSGIDGFSRRVWNASNVSSNSVTFTLIDPAASNNQGFPGTVLTTVIYTLQRHSTWKISIHATASAKTPIMLTGHHYWNLEAYQESQDLIGHFSKFKASKFVATDGNLIPTGQLSHVSETPMNFKEAKSIGTSIPATAEAQFCGTGCVGYDNCWLFDTVDDKKAAFSAWSVNSGIKLDILTNQPAVQMFSCNGVSAASIPRKTTQGGPGAIYTDHSCIAIEIESVIDAINNPEFGVDQIYGPGRAYDWEAFYVFSNIRN
ncbi:hypothetical protein GALMADRAFT_239324 [Galerina marginata CBS 339.88]|uniref:Aldose 1-epimerase n=1 Tax=Galerina marginata (strain CBS 339.88) TaxID=685588 RepID=A0A067TR85_GALM3|nr:hypothetical protein GALMADRAFT_239324 [Galerina marginata CBS 339.88]